MSLTHGDCDSASFRGSILVGVVVGGGGSGGGIGDRRTGLGGVVPRVAVLPDAERYGANGSSVVGTSGSSHDPPYTFILPITQSLKMQKTTPFKGHTRSD
jgi:hypothetical protein